jgi:hypothetical protein
MAENSKEPRWAGWRRQPPSTDDSPYQGVAVHVGPIPGRKRIALYTMDYTNGNVMHVHAYFRSVEEGQKFLRYLGIMVTGNFKEEDE